MRFPHLDEKAAAVMTMQTVAEGEEVHALADKVFAAESVEAIVAGLAAEAHASALAKSTLGALQCASPLALEVAHQLIAKSAGMDLGEALRLERAVAARAVDRWHADGGRPQAGPAPGAPEWGTRGLFAAAEAEAEAFFEAPAGDMPFEAPGGARVGLFDEILAGIVVAP